MDANPGWHSDASVARRRATRAAFGAVGFGMAAWAPLVPFARQRLAVGDGRLGLLLLCLGLGSFLTLPLAGTLVARFGPRRVICTAGLCLCATLPGLAVAAQPLLLGAALLLFGAAVAAADVAMNLQAVLVEQAGGRAVMSGFHACFSLGCIAGAGFVDLLLGAGASPLLAACGAALVIIATLLAYSGAMLPRAEGVSGQARLLVRPRGVVLLIGVLCAIAFLAEGAMLDWSGVFLTTHGHWPPALAGIGYAGFSVAMTAGRFAGDGIVRRYGPPRVVIAGAICASLGLVLAVCLPGAASVGGFALVGLGLANVVPVFFSALGRQSAMPANLAVSAASTLGYAGFLAGPALIGGIAELAGLPAALLAVAALLLVVAARAQTATR